MDYQEKLRELGLHKTEAIVYVYLLEQGLSSPPQIAKSTHVLVTNLYHVLRGLKEKGLINEIPKGKRKAYLANDPEAIARMVDLKKHTAEQLIPDLRGLYALQKNKPTIRYYDGFDQVREIYLQTLSAQEVRGIGSTKLLSDLEPEFYSYYVSQLKQRGVVFYDLLTHPSKTKGAAEAFNVLKGLYEARFLPAKYQDQPTDILIWHDNIALITFEQPIFGTVISSPLIARTLKIVFEVMWDALPQR